MEKEKETKVLTPNRVQQLLNVQQEGLELFNQAPELESILGKSFCSIYKALKRYEAEAFLQVISPWEREHLLLNV